MIIHSLFIERIFKLKKIVSFALCAALAFCSAAVIPLEEGFGTAVTAEAASVSVESELLPYYYGFMTKDEQRLYLQLRKAAMSGEPSVRLQSSLSDESYSRLIGTLFYYDPLAFNISAVDGMHYSGRTEVKFEYGIENDEYNYMLAEMEAVSDKINSKFKKNTSDYAKIKYIHDYLTKNSDYKEGEEFSHYAYGALCDGYAVCDGYAGAFAYLCGKAGIQTVNVVGEAGGVSHTWNKVLCGGNWYNVDVTWDDPVTNFRENETYNYFMIDDGIMGKTHTEKPMGFSSPEASDGSGNYFARNKLVASSITEAKNILTAQIVSAAKKGKLTASVRMTDEKTYKAVVSYFEKNNSKSALAMLSSAKKKSGANIITKGMKSVKNEDCYTYTICIFYEDTKISDYYNAPELLDKDTLKYFKGLGININ